MKLPFFYSSNYNEGQKQIALNEDTSRHIVQVLRMKEGEELNLTDGKGNLLTCVITNENKKHCTVEVKGIRHKAPACTKASAGKQGTRKVSIAISLLKNRNRFEWFLEKATEIGVSEIIPLICERTEKEKFRHDRMNAICISAMLQSQQCWLPVLQEPVLFNHPAIQQSNFQQKFIAHCDDTNKRSLRKVLPSGEDLGGASLILIGPEGDFTQTEIERALENGFSPVSLGETRLRSETAGVVAAALLCQI
ncbi:MAG: RsmE family RNA methyltransferase [Bacteroidota bacterium]